MSDIQTIVHQTRFSTLAIYIISQTASTIDLSYKAEQSTIRVFSELWIGVKFNKKISVEP